MSSSRNQSIDLFCKSIADFYMMVAVGFNGLPPLKSNHFYPLTIVVFPNYLGVASSMTLCVFIFWVRNYSISHVMHTKFDLCGNTSHIKAINNAFSSLIFSPRTSKHLMCTVTLRTGISIITMITAVSWSYLLTRS